MQKNSVIDFEPYYEAHEAEPKPMIRIMPRVYVLAAKRKVTKLKTIRSK